MNDIQQLSKSQGPANITRWQANQVVVTHHSNLDITQDKQTILHSLDFTALNQALQTNSGFQLESFTLHDVARPAPKKRPPEDSDLDDSFWTNAEATEQTSLESPLGKYLFPDPSGQGTLVVSFFHLKEAQNAQGQFKEAQNVDAPRDGTPDVVHLINKKLISDVQNAQSQSKDIKNVDEQHDSTPDVVHLINEKLKLFSPVGAAKLLAAMPNWLNGGTLISLGCPATPPFPVSDTPAGLNWHIQLPPELPETLRNATGKGVHVFVLDTMPEEAQISQAAAREPNNKLLRDIANNVDFHYYHLADSLDKPNTEQPATGSDVYNRLVGFRMNDHGVFIAGIIRDIAPDAKVECIRVLNDYAVGNAAMLTDALSRIQNRLLPLNPQTKAPGDLYAAHARVVVNLSLTVPPSEESLAQLGFTDETIAKARLGLFLPMQALASYGVVFAASAGNGSGPHDFVTQPPNQRVHPDYPAAFAYQLPGVEEEYILPSMIPVGAVNQAGAAASYSNYPGPEGIGAYGGELPQPLPATPDNGTYTRVQFPVDALRGVYTNRRYAALSKDDPYSLSSPPPISYPEYEPTPPATWAYWSGTSFATPIISALAARVLEHQSPSGDSVRRTLREAAPGVAAWTNLDTPENHAYGPMFMVWQCTREDE